MMQCPPLCCHDSRGEVVVVGAPSSLTVLYHYDHQALQQKRKEDLFLLLLLLLLACLFLCEGGEATPLVSVIRAAAAASCLPGHHSPPLRLTASGRERRPGALVAQHAAPLGDPSYTLLALQTLLSTQLPRRVTYPHGSANGND